MMPEGPGRLMAEAHLRILIEDELYDRVLNAYTSCERGPAAHARCGRILRCDHGGPLTEASTSRLAMSASLGTPRQGAIRRTAVGAVELFAELERAGDGTTS
jgi:hypothetical protein